jgi:hypothetical protein
MSTDVHAIIAGAIDDRYGVMFAEDVLAALDASGVEIVTDLPDVIADPDPEYADLYYTVVLSDGSYYVPMNHDPAQAREKAAAFLAVARYLENLADTEDGAR